MQSTADADESKKLLQSHIDTGCQLHTIDTTASLKVPCSYISCKVIDMFTSVCSKCNKGFCLKLSDFTVYWMAVWKKGGLTSLTSNIQNRHRHDVNHDCLSLGQEVKDKELKSSVIKQFLAERLPQSPASSSSEVKATIDPSPKNNRSVKKLNPKIEMMKMRAKAVVSHSFTLHIWGAIVSLKVNLKC